ncbi:hypothetical protein NM688_g528 [Phlebia brevispora]|uniref:Uncharacterized protein n=1 Tax=Phlebia brevispora TaxID=194682 RepID=A0ACC1TDS9_9APHY|nr:hypothetical protein NM688_g528 [Phlebia brevispora]
MSNPIPTKQKALVIPAKHAPFVIAEVDVPKPGPGEILVREEAIGLNPADWMVHDLDPFQSNYPFIIGMETAGTVIQLGEGVTSFAVGDKVFFAGSVFNGHPSFRQYNLTAVEFCAKVPSNLTLDQAASIPIAVETAGLGLFSRPVNDADGGAGLTPPWEEGGRGKYADQPILILGGSTAIGQPAIQFSKMCGFSPIITTASLRNAELLKSSGATHVIDRNLSGADFAAAVKAITRDPIRIVYDATSNADIQLAAYDLLSSGGTADKTVTFVVGFKEQFRELGISMWKHMPAWFESGDLKPNNIEVVPGGLGGIPSGLERLKNGEVSARKLIVHPNEVA